MPLLQTDMQSLLIKGLRLQRQRAQRPAQLPTNYKNTSKRRERVYHCLLWLSQKTEHQSKRRRKRIKRFWKERG